MRRRQRDQIKVGGRISHRNRKLSLLGKARFSPVEVRENFQTRDQRFVKSAPVREDLAQFSVYAKTDARKGVLRFDVNIGRAFA